MHDYRHIFLMHINPKHSIWLIFQNIHRYYSDHHLMHTATRYNSIVYNLNLIKGYGGMRKGSISNIVFPSAFLITANMSEKMPILWSHTCALLLFHWYRQGQLWYRML